MLSAVLVSPPLGQLLYRAPFAPVLPFLLILLQLDLILLQSFTTTDYRLLIPNLEVDANRQKLTTDRKQAGLFLLMGLEWFCFCFCASKTTLVFMPLQLKVVTLQVRT